MLIFPGATNTQNLGGDWPALGGGGNSPQKNPAVAAPPPPNGWAALSYDSQYPSLGGSSPTPPPRSTSSTTTTAANRNQESSPASWAGVAAAGSNPTRPSNIPRPTSRTTPRHRTTKVYTGFHSTLLFQICTTYLCQTAQGLPQSLIETRFPVHVLCGQCYLIF